MKMRILIALFLLWRLLSAGEPVRVGDPALCLDCREGGGVHGLVFSPDGARLATGHNDSLRIWDAKSGKLRTVIEDRATVYGFHWFKDGRLAYSGKGNVVTIHDLKNRRPRVDARGINPAVGFYLAADRAGSTLVSAACDNHEVIVWDLPRLRERCRLKHNAPVWQAALSKDGTRAFVGDTKGQVAAFDARTGRLLWRHKGHDSRVFALDVSPDGKHVASGAGAPDRTVKVWDAATGKLKATWRVGTVVRAVAFSPDSKTVAVGGNRRRVELRDLKTGKVRRRFATKAWVAALAFAPDGKRLAAGTLDATAWVWKL